MTPFMLRVAELVGADPDDDPELPIPALSPARRRAAGEGADRYMGLRSLSEQLVCEANAVLDEMDDHLTPTDEVGGEELAYRINFRGRAARVSMRFQGHTAYGQIVGDGILANEPVELVDVDALPDLIVLLLMESDLTHHPR